MDIGKKRGRPCKDKFAKDKLFTVRLTPLEMNMLECLSRSKRESKSELIRKFVRQSYEDSDYDMYDNYYIDPEEAGFEEEW